MSWYNHGVAFVIIYMLTLFCVLPIGVRTAAEAGTELVPGQADSAPSNPRLGFKFLLTFLISCGIFAIYYLIGYFGLIDPAALFGRGT
jgi:predicted secreted protein